MTFSSLIMILTGPDGESFCFTNNNNATNNKVITKKAVTVAITVPNVPAANIILLIYFYVVS